MTKNRGLYNSDFEHDSCGVGCIANIDNKTSRSIVSDALLMLSRMEHRGATGSDKDTGDGAGILTQIPHPFFEVEFKKIGCKIPPKGNYGIGMIFYPQQPVVTEQCHAALNRCIAELNFELVGYRRVPVNSQVLGYESKMVEPYIEQVCVKPKNKLSEEDLERKLFVLSNYVTNSVSKDIPAENGEFYLCSFSCRTVIYKGQLKTDQLSRYFYDLQSEEYQSVFAIVHSRFSTNTFPNWKLAQPFRYLAHNGEINTIRGNVNKMKSKEAVMHSKVFSKEELSHLLPVTKSDNSDSANLDAIVQLLTLSGRSMPHVMMMLVPEAWQDNSSMDKNKKAFYKYHASITEPWDGPAALFYTNGVQLGASLDRNGLRPVRYTITKTRQIIMASETGTIPVDESLVLEKGRLQPGKIIWIDLLQKKVIKDDEVKKEIISQSPYQQWINDYRVKLRLLPKIKGAEEYVVPRQHTSQLRTYGCTKEDIKEIILPMAIQGKEPIGAMGVDTPIAVMSKQSQHLANYFKQYFAQVSNPPIDPIRERLVMSLFTRLGKSFNILEEKPEHAEQIHISRPILNQSAFLKLKHLKKKVGMDYAVIEATFSKENETLKEAIKRICSQAEKQVNAGKNILIISNRTISTSTIPIPSLLATGAVHHHLIRKNLLVDAGIVVEGGDVWETHHFATLAGYGASAVYPFKVFEILKDYFDRGELDTKVSLEEYIEQYSLGVSNGILKILSKMGISTLQSYQGAQIFENVGLSDEVISACFKGTVSRISGLTFEDLEKEARIKHQSGYNSGNEMLETGGVYQWKRNGESHLLSPEIIHLLQKSTSLNDYSLFKKYSQKINDHQNTSITLRSMFEFKERSPIPIEEVEPIENIFRRFATGAMSFGSISYEAHTTLAIAMNRIGGKSNSGEGGEDERRYTPFENGDYARSAIKQVASGRFGVTINYLNEAKEIQIKIAQGAKPGEGGQLPGHKVDDWIAKVRHSTPGIGLISPPPHHDIYSIEDLKQLIFDLKNANRKARINVKLVSEAGVGTIASGVAKAKADVILISGYDGGTGASPLSSIRHAGLPWEMGLAEAHQTLLKNNLRSRVVLQTDGKLMTGRDIAMATLLGAEEYGFSTAALIVEGCIMMRKCHLNICPVGIATQKEELRRLFTGDPQHLVNFFTFLAMELREIMARLGFATINEMVGRSDVLKVRNNLNHWKLNNADFTPIIHKPNVPASFGTYCQIEQDHELEDVLDQQIITDYLIEKQNNVSYTITNVDRSVGTMFSNEVTKKFGKKGIEAALANIKFVGSAGQSFGAFLAPGIRFELEGEANDYCGKGLSGGMIIIKIHKEATFIASKNTIIGNVAFYGATLGHAYINGHAGERFCVRNSGMEAVVEGIGDHGCEYMTGGKVIVLGDIGQNFAAGMSGGMAYIYQPKPINEGLINIEMVSLDTTEDEDLDYIHLQIKRHVEYTNSILAQEILLDWETNAASFVKIIPNELKNLLLLKKENKKTA